MSMPPTPSVSEWWSFRTQRGPATLEPLDEGGLPQRSITIEAGHAGLAGELQDRLQRPGRCGLEPADVPGQVEVGIDDPAGRGQPQRRLHHLLPETGRDAGEPLEPLRQPIPVRCALEHQDDDDRRSQQRVLLHVPGERVGVAHVDLDPTIHTVHILDNVQRVPADNATGVALSIRLH